MKRCILLIASEGDTIWAALYRIRKSTSPQLLRHYSGTGQVPLWLRWSSLIYPAILLPQNVPFTVKLGPPSGDGPLHNLGIPLVERELFLDEKLYSCCAREASLDAALRQLTEQSICVSSILPTTCILLAWMQRSPQLQEALIVHQLGESLLLLQDKRSELTIRYKRVPQREQFKQFVAAELSGNQVVLLGTDTALAEGDDVSPLVSMPETEGKPPPPLNIAATLGQALIEQPNFLSSEAQKSAATWRALTACTVLSATAALIATGSTFAVKNRREILRNEDAALAAEQTEASRQQKQLQTLKEKLVEVQAQKDAVVRWQRTPQTIDALLMQIDQALEACPSVTLQTVWADYQPTLDLRITGIVSNAEGVGEVQQLAKVIDDAAIELRPLGSGVAFVISSRSEHGNRTR